MDDSFYIVLLKPVLVGTSQGLRRYFLLTNQSHKEAQHLQPTIVKGGTLDCKCHRWTHPAKGWDEMLRAFKSSYVHLLTFPDVPLCLHIRTAGEAVTETMPGWSSTETNYRQRGGEEISHWKAASEFNPLIPKQHLKTQNCCWKRQGDHSHNSNYSCAQVKTDPCKFQPQEALKY